MMKTNLNIIEVIICLSLSVFFILSPYTSYADSTSEFHYNSITKDLYAEAIIEYPDGWYYTLNQMKKLYDAEYSAGKRLKNHIRYKDGRFLAQCNGQFIEVPERFIFKTLKLLQELLAGNYARYLFRLDACHAHPFVPEETYMLRYSNLNTYQMIDKFVHEDSLGALFHSAEHLALRNPPGSGMIDLEAHDFIRKRNVIGWYDDNPLQIVKPKKTDLIGSGGSYTARIPEGYRTVGSIVFKATNKGEFRIKNQGKVIRLDISLDEHYYH